MFVIINYDIEKTRCVKVMKFLRRYLHHMQGSVFVGEITDKRLREIRMGLRNLIVEAHDKVIIYRIVSVKAMDVEVLGSQHWIEYVI